MRTTLPLPLLGAAVVTVGAVVFRLARPSGDQRPAAGPASLPADLVNASLARLRGSQNLSLPERLREHGF